MVWRRWWMWRAKLGNACDDNDEDEGGVEAGREPPAERVGVLDGGVEAVGGPVERVDVDERDVAAREVLQPARRGRAGRARGDGRGHGRSHVVHGRGDDDAHGDVRRRGARVLDDGVVRAERAVVLLGEDGVRGRLSSSGGGGAVERAAVVARAVRGAVECGERERAAGGADGGEVRDGAARDK